MNVPLGKVGETCREHIFDLLLGFRDCISDTLGIGLGVVNAETNHQRLSLETGIKKINLLENLSNRLLSSVTILPKEKRIRIRIYEKVLEVELRNFMGDTIKTGPDDSHLSTFNVEYIQKY